MAQMIKFLVSLGYSKSAARKKARAVRADYEERKRTVLTKREMIVRASDNMAHRW